MYKFTIVTLCFACIFMVARAQRTGQKACDAVKNATHSFTCKIITACPEAKDIIRTGGLPVACGFLNRVQQVCCSEKLPTKITPVIPTKDVYKIAQTKCLEYGKARFVNRTIPGVYPGAPPKILSVLDCVKAETLIVGGNNTNPKEFPHMALIGFNARLDEASWDCGGTLISERYVLSAAHCSVGSLGEAKWVRLGELVVNSDIEGKHYVDYSIAERRVHPGYKAPQVYNDIVLFKLASDVNFNAYIRPICLYTSVVIPPVLQNKAVITGWGYTGAGEQKSDPLLKATVTYLDDKECVTVYGNDKESFGRGYDPKTMICAGDKLNGKDTCGGDSGGPLQIPITDFQCMWSQIGITSIGSTFCGDRKPAVYTELYNYIPWIVPIVWP